MKCPECNEGTLNVINTTSDDNCVYRKRRCSFCGKEYYTKEIFDPNSKYYLYSIKNNKYKR